MVTVGNKDQKDHFFLDFPLDFFPLLLGWHEKSVPKSHVLSHRGESLASFPGKPWTSSRFLGLNTYTYWHHPGSSMVEKNWILHWDDPHDPLGPYKTDLSLEQLRRPPCIEGTCARVGAVGADKSGRWSPKMLHFHYQEMHHFCFRMSPNSGHSLQRF